MKKALRNGLEPLKPCGRHNVLPEDSEAEAEPEAEPEAEAESDTLAWIQHQAEKLQPFAIYYRSSTRTEQNKHPPLMCWEIRQGYHSRVDGFILITA
jgi:hypothetical protein